MATGLTYMQQRYYDADIGRFISPDPVGPEEDFVNHFNRYNYALNNPLRYTDPDGREPACRKNPCNPKVDKIREDIAKNALDSLKKNEPYGLFDKNEKFQSGTYKCNLFVCNIANNSGANIGLNTDSNGNKWPPTAGVWGDPNAKTKGWKVVVNPQPGDIVAQKRGYSDASGHVGIIVDKDLNVVSARDNGLSIDKLEILFPSNYRNGEVKTGPVVYRRYIGIEE